MRVQLVSDSASTEQVRKLGVALHRIGMTGELKVGLNGPEKWTFTSPHLTERQFALVVGNLVTFEGKPIADLLPLHDGDEFSMAGTLSREDWQYEVQNGDTVLGFAEWCEHQIEASS